MEDVKVCEVCQQEYCRCPTNLEDLYCGYLGPNGCPDCG